MQDRETEADPDPDQIRSDQITRDHLLSDRRYTQCTADAGSSTLHRLSACSLVCVAWKAAAATTTADVEQLVVDANQLQQLQRWLPACAERVSSLRLRKHGFDRDGLVRLELDCSRLSRLQVLALQGYRAVLNGPPSSSSSAGPRTRSQCRRHQQPAAGNSSMQQAQPAAAAGTACSSSSSCAGLPAVSTPAAGPDPRFLPAPSQQLPALEPADTPPQPHAGIPASDPQPRRRRLLNNLEPCGGSSSSQPRRRHLQYTEPCGGSSSSRRAPAAAATQHHPPHHHQPTHAAAAARICSLTQLQAVRLAVPFTGAPAALAMLPSSLTILNLKPMGTPPGQQHPPCFSSVTVPQLPQLSTSLAQLTLTDMQLDPAALSSLSRLQ